MEYPRGTLTQILKHSSMYATVFSIKLETSTKIIYSVFEGKDRLINALFLEGSMRLCDYMEAAPEQDNSSAYIRASAVAYWDFAQHNLGYYKFMFANATPNFKAKKDTMQTVA